MDRSEVPIDIQSTLDAAGSFLPARGFIYCGSAKMVIPIGTDEKPHFINVYFNAEKGVLATAVSFFPSLVNILYTSFFSDGQSLETVNRHFDWVIMPHSGVKVINDWFQHDDQVWETHQKWLSDDERSPLKDRETVLSLARSQYLTVLEDWTKQGYMKAKNGYWHYTWLSAYRFYVKIKKQGRRPAKVPPFRGL
jgi:hypothetical protein